MNKGFYYLGIILLYCTLQSSIYDIEIKKMNGDSISMSKFTDKKIIVILVNAANPDAAHLRYLDSLQLADESLQVIGIPATDFTGEGKHENLNAFRNSLSSKFVITKQAAVIKETGVRQQPLLRWLTHASENGHFDANAKDAGQLFIVNKKGVLYSVLEPGVPRDVLIQVINQEIK